VSLTDWHGEREYPEWVAAVRAIAKRLGRPELYDRARAAAAVKGTVARTKEPAVMDLLWKNWSQLASAFNGGLWGLADRQRLLDRVRKTLEI
jgi:hypothetical protein